MLWKLALRNLWRNRRRTLLTMSALVVSAALLILALGVFSGMFADMLESATQQYHGHLVISRQGYQEQRRLHDYFPVSPDLLKKLQENPEIIGSSPRLRSFGLLSGDEKTEPGELLGVDPQREARVTTLSEKIVSGRLPESGTGNWVVLGSGLADKLGVRTGAELVFVTQAADGSIGNDLLRVAGIFSTGDRSRDNSLALVSLGWLQQFMALENRWHEIALTVTDPLQAAKLIPAIENLLDRQLEVLDWGQLLPEMKEVIASYDVTRFILVAILYAATGLGVLNTFFMSVLERVKEFGVLLAVGMKPGSIRNLVLVESLILGAISLVFGALAGLGLSLYMANVGIDLSGWITPVTYAGGTIMPRLGAEIEWANFSIPSICLLLICLGAAYLPARRASRLVPVAALRGE